MMGPHTGNLLDLCVRDISGSDAGGESDHERRAKSQVIRAAHVVRRRTTPERQA
jgi:hypothetical protein